MKLMIEQPARPIYLTVWGSVLVAFLLTAMPLPGWTTWLRPNWLLLVVLYWVLRLPHRYQVGFAWLLGLLNDALVGDLLGAQALLLAVAAYFAGKFNRQFQMFPWWQQVVGIFLLSFISQLLLIFLQGAVGQSPQSWLVLGAPVTTAVLWPWLSTLLDSLLL